MLRCTGYGALDWDSGHDVNSAWLHCIAEKTKYVSLGAGVRSG